MEQWKIHKDRVKCDKPGCSLAAEMEYFAILQLPDCIRLERCQNCFGEIQRSGQSMPFHWKIRRTVDGKQQPILDLESLRTLFDTLGQTDPEASSGDESEDNAAASAPEVSEQAEGGDGSAAPLDATEVASGLRYLVALLLIRKRRLKMVDALTPGQEAADLVVIDPKVEGMEPVALFAPSLDPERLAGLREELTAAIGV